MTETAAPRRAGDMPGRLAARIPQLQRRLSDRMFADGDAFARQHGWTITKTSGRLGFGGRTYRDPRFDQRRATTRRGEPPSSEGTGLSR